MKPAVKTQLSVQKNLILKANLFHINKRGIVFTKHTLSDNNQFTKKFG